MRRRAGSTRAGLTLVELVVGLSLLGVIGGAVVLASGSTSSAVQSASTLAELQSVARVALERIASQLVEVRRADVQPAAPGAEAPFHASSLDFQKLRWTGAAVELDDVARLAFELAPGELDDDLDNDGNGLVDDGLVVLIEGLGTAGERRFVVCRHVAGSLAGETPGNGADDNGNGLIDEGGLCFEFDGD
jgi:hypothetical protein